jgi:hypothetical protein
LEVRWSSRYLAPSKGKGSERFTLSSSRSGQITYPEGGNPVSTLVGHTNEMSRDAFGDLTPECGIRPMTAETPVLATPAAVAAGVAVTAGAFAAGFAAEETADG